jgi:RND family efflux transporter MFP subunit
MKKLLVTLVVFIAAGFASYMAYLHYRYILAEAARVQYQPIKEVVSEEGIVKPAKEIDLSSEIQAKVLRLPVKEGDRVSEGALVCELDGSVLKSQLEEVRAQLEVQRSRLEELVVEVEHLRKTCERCKQLLADGTVSQQYYDDQKAKLDTAERRYVTAQATLESTTKSMDVFEVRLSKTRIHSPIRGSIITIDIEEGEVAVPGKPIMNIVDESQIRIEAEIAEAHIGLVHPGQKVFVSADSLPDITFNGTLARIDPLALPKGEIIEVTRAAEERVFRGIIALEKEDPPFHPGMSVYVDFLTGYKERALTIPSEAIFSEGKNYFVYIIEEDHAKKVKVRTGLRDVLTTEIIEGLKEGDRVITSDLTKVKDGYRIKIKDEEQ